MGKNINFDIETALAFVFIFYLYANSALEERGNTMQ
jgi:hypothetical protein